MGLFHRRYLSIFAFAFVFCSFVAIFLDANIKLLFALVLLLPVIPLGIIMALNKKIRFVVLIVTFCITFAGSGFLSSYVFISKPQQEASKYIGQNSVEIQVLGQESLSDKSSEYTVRVKQIGDDITDIKAYLYCDFESELSFGDRVIAVADISNNGEYSKLDRSLLLILSIDSSQPVLYKKSDTVDYFSMDGIISTCNGIRKGFVGYVDSLFEGEDGGLVKGLLINEKSGLSAKTILNFRRSGVSHLLAVSGVHVSLLLGAFEVLLRKLLVPRKIRCLAVAVAGGVLLALSGFSPSAVRSVLMLFSVYIAFVLYDDHDSATSLFVAVFIIILLSPYSIYDLGMWMSFFATLGLVSVYPYTVKWLRYKKGEKKIVDILKRSSIFILKLSLITIVANFFLLPISWYFFGEISLASVFTNIALSPITTLYLPLSAISLIFGKLPLIGHLLVMLTSVLGKSLLKITEFFSGMRGAVLSLRFPFVTVLILLFCVSFVPLLVLKLKKKFWICIPPIAFTALFSICLCVFYLTYDPQLKYVGKKDNEFLIVEECGKITVCDISNGTSASAMLFEQNISPYASEIEDYIVTHAHKNHAYAVERVLKNNYVRNLYLPLTQDKDELVFVSKIYDMAKEYDAKVIFYESGREIELFSELTVRPFFEPDDKSEHTSVYVTVQNKDERFLTYTDAYELNDALGVGSKSKYLLLGTHGEYRYYEFEMNDSTDMKIIVPNRQRSWESNTVAWSANRYVMQSNIWTLPLS